MNRERKRPRLLVLGTGMRHSVTSRCDEHVIVHPSTAAFISDDNRDGPEGTGGLSGRTHNSMVPGHTLFSLASSLVRRAIVSRGECQSGAIFADLTPILALFLLRETSSHLSAPQLTQIEANLLSRSADRPSELPSEWDEEHVLDRPSSDHSREDEVVVEKGKSSASAKDPLVQALKRVLEQGWEEQVRRLRGQTRGCPERAPREDVHTYYGRLAEHQKRRLADIGERLRDAYGREEAAVRTSKLIGPIKAGEGVHQRTSSPSPFPGASTSSALMKKSRQEALLSGRGSSTRTIASISSVSSGPTTVPRTAIRTGSRTSSSSTPMGILLPPRRK